MPVYNKLVRDHVPSAIAANGKSFRTRRLSEAEYAQALKTKLREEADEYARARDDLEALEELADMLEVIRALSAVHGAGWERLESIRFRKAEARGGFEERLFLLDVDDSK
ncbi:nucleoside triphosphate pyrophosphohydrolase [Paenibacillus ginsengarvi]|uniref:Phosphoribosyl-ATP pyrophosphohydrolase n=1 Tax=Paenibacillus ginsengarvi TaxID=400777 RepID=A0A3B0CIF7_9BACL|nr:nucleoside triphosphate pyrophosphohydrolase [Paenibacillus ginsengarvi]RKN84077.1 hypothetical protein D7M11_15685 [Paenibacillus ginsengarvi]